MIDGLLYLGGLLVLAVIFDFIHTKKLIKCKACGKK